MTHFGFALGVITASVIGGAFVVDHHLKNSPDIVTQSTPRVAIAEAPATAPASSAEVDAPVKLAEAATVTPRESAARSAEPPKAAKVPVRSAPTRSLPSPAVADTPASVPADVTPPATDSSSTPSSEPPEKSDPPKPPVSPPDA